MIFGWHTVDCFHYVHQGRALSYKTFFQWLMISMYQGKSGLFGPFRLGLIMGSTFRSASRGRDHDHVTCPL